MPKQNFRFQILQLGRHDWLCRFYDFCDQVIHKSRWTRKKQAHDDCCQFRDDYKAREKEIQRNITLPKGEKWGVHRFFGSRSCQSFLTLFA